MAEACKGKKLEKVQLHWCTSLQPAGSSFSFLCVVNDFVYKENSFLDAWSTESKSSDSLLPQLCLLY